ncbi:hypothetical protein NDU88_002248 [Pleurodeles waltl]|uniref:Uncharacterized protein n=1 Tax=Pleurodeles waltl TaxID=8319 RepID=A0AAV7MQV2_PLEWA|nr:hypothetical protein NDU88_002248 [Pleurodeles waltl]
MPNSGPPASPHQESSARVEKRPAVGPVTFDTGRSFPRARLGDAAGRHGPTSGISVVVDGVPVAVLSGGPEKEE